MKELITSITSQLGVSESDARSATGGLLALIRGNVAEKDFQQVAAAIPGSEQLLQEAPAAAQPEAPKGGLGGLVGKAAAAAGQKLGADAGIAGLLGGTGLNASQAGSLVTIVVGHLKEKLGSGTVDRLLGQIPALKQLLG